MSSYHMDVGRSTPRKTNSSCSSSINEHQDEIPRSKSIKNPVTGFGKVEYQFNSKGKGDTDVDDHCMRIQSLFKETQSGSEE